MRNERQEIIWRLSNDLGSKAYSTRLRQFDRLFRVKKFHSPNDFITAARMGRSSSGYFCADRATWNDVVGDARVKIDAQCLIVARRRATRQSEASDRLASTLDCYEQL